MSTAVRSGDMKIVFALARSRETLARLRSDPSCALLVLDRDLAFTAIGTTRIVRERMESSDRVAALELVVEDVLDHLADQRTLIRSGAVWDWASEEDAARDAAIRRELSSLVVE